MCTETLNAGGVYIRTRVPSPSPREAYIYALLHVPANARPQTHLTFLPRFAALVLTQQRWGIPFLELCRHSHAKTDIVNKGNGCIISAAGILFRVLYVIYKPRVCSSEPLPLIAMAARDVFTLDDVMNELDADDLFEDESEDDFDGYLDADSDGERDESDEGDERDMGDERDNAEDSDVGGDNVEMDAGTSDDLPEYILTPGCTASAEGSRPLSYFSLLVTNDMLRHIVDQTNLCANQYIGSHELGPHSRVRRWTKRVHNICELLRFLAIIIIMEIVRYPQIESHWSTLWPFSNTHFASVSAYAVDILHDNVDTKILFVITS